LAASAGERSSPAAIQPAHPAQLRHPQAQIVDIIRALRARTHARFPTPLDESRSSNALFDPNRALVDAPSPCSDPTQHGAVREFRSFFGFAVLENACPAAD